MAKENPTPVKRSYLYRSTYVWVALILSIVSLGSTLYVALSFPLMRDWMDYLWPIHLSSAASFLLILILGRESKALDDHRVESSPEYISEADAKRALSHAIFFVAIGIVISLFVNVNGNLTIYLILTIFITSMAFSVLFSARERIVNDSLSTISHEVKELKSSKADIDKMRQSLSDHEKLLQEVLKELKELKESSSRASGGVA